MRNTCCRGFYRVSAGILTGVLAGVLAAFMLVCATTSTALAAGMNSISTTYVRDHYQLLSESSVQELENTAAQLANTYQCAPYITIVNDIGQKTVRDYAESYWLENNLGLSSDKDGIMFLFAVDSRDYVTITHGQGETGGITMFTDYRISQIEQEVVDELKDNNWEDACETFLNEVNQTCEYYRTNNTAWDVSNDPIEARKDLIIKIAIAVLISAGVAGLLCWHWAGQMKTARAQTQANAYLEQGSLVLTQKSDRFVTTNRTVVKIQHEHNNDNDSGFSSGFGGGSSVSSSGFGGSSGGKF